MKWKLSRNAIDNAGAELPKLAEKYFRDGRKALDKERTPKQLHRFRIETKQFRYALELFAPIYGPTLDRHIGSLRGIQDALGKVSDFQTILEMLAGDKKWEAKVQKAQQKKMKEFREEWKKLDSEGQLHRWKTYLSRVPSAEKRPQSKRGPSNKGTPASEAKV